MSLSSERLALLLGAIETDSLVVLCGAGVSLAPPSNLLSAKEVGQICYDQLMAYRSIDPALRGDLGALASHCHSRGEMDHFLHAVPWDSLVGEPNASHAALADFLITRAVQAVLTTNIDALIEHWAEEHKVALQGALDGQEAVRFNGIGSPLLKLHGCIHRGRESTVWAPGQLAEPPISDRIASWLKWMSLHLPSRHLLVLGFWSEWGYLNDAFANCFNIRGAGSVTVVDVRSSTELENSVPSLWQLLSDASDDFAHEEVPAEEVLQQLRYEFSKAWLRQFFALANRITGGAGAQPMVDALLSTLPMQALYNLRRDAEGFPYTHAAHQKRPRDESAQAALVCHSLVVAGATFEGRWFTWKDSTIRVVKGAGRGLNELRDSYKEPPAVSDADFVVCAGAIDDGLPGRIIASGHGASVVRPQGGGRSEWLTIEQARARSLI